MSILVTAGMVVQKIFALHLHLLSKPIASHRTALFALHSHFAFASHFSQFFSAFLHFFHLFGRFFTVIESKPRKKSAKKYAKKCENAKNAKKVRYTNAMRKKKNQKFASHRTNEAKKKIAFSHFFASHYHP
jgi:hypothetical protein